MLPSDDQDRIRPVGDAPFINGADKAQIIRFLCFTMPFGGFFAALHLLILTLLHGQAPENETTKDAVRIGITFAFWAGLYYLAHDVLGWWQ